MKIGFIGAGNMGGAIIEGYGKINDEDEIIVYDKNPEKTKGFLKYPNVLPSGDMEGLIGRSDIIVFALKPNIFDEIIPELKDIFDNTCNNKSKTTCSISDTVFVSLAAGISLSYLENMLGEERKFVRVMPNTPALVGEGMAALTKNKNVTDDEIKKVISIFNAVGNTIMVEEGQMDIVTGISGSSPAFAYMYIETLIDCGMKSGLDRETATKLAAQSTLGAAKMVLETGEDPAILRDNVCSPGGATIEGVKKLDSGNFNKDIKSAVKAVMDKSQKMTK